MDRFRKRSLLRSGGQAGGGEESGTPVFAGGKHGTDIRQANRKVQVQGMENGGVLSAATDRYPVGRSGDN